MAGAVGTCRSKQEAKQLAAALCIEDALSSGMAAPADFHHHPNPQKRKVRCSEVVVCGSVCLACP